MTSHTGSESHWKTELLLLLLLLLLVLLLVVLLLVVVVVLEVVIVVLLAWYAGHASAEHIDVALLLLVGVPVVGDALFSSECKSKEGGSSGVPCGPSGQPATAVSLVPVLVLAPALALALALAQRAEAAALDQNPSLSAVLAAAAAAAVVVVVVVLAVQQRSARYWSTASVCRQAATVCV